ncbi:rod shape-determining protein MreD [Treponema parvum]|uniref:Rod shape-determining protein MreD n=1 Tax=Treponema parvum TaxID=138851 RepID=A0A975IEE0_9SPIR|nr:rod shape-determining protein MreD [Treponema parvum]QTQ11877.1 rod shape-determining protein MreD [Treponema parvum]QTQ13935.1 rod shape-determining protein MreD [Treponema parvum]QTQ16145.1 rod shape-determining protein MreD [Treponema parvum]
MVKYICILLSILLGFAVFESAILSNILFLPAIPDFLLLCVLYCSFSYGRRLGEIAGFFSGIITDFLSGCPFGLNALLRTMLGYTSGFFSKTFSTAGVLMPALIAACGTVYKMFLLWFISLFYRSVSTYNPFSFLFLTELALNVFFAPIVFKFMSVFDPLYSKEQRLPL